MMYSYSYDIELYHAGWWSPVILMGRVKLKLSSVFWHCDLLTHCNVDTSPPMIAETFFSTTGSFFHNLPGGSPKPILSRDLLSL